MSALIRNLRVNFVILCKSIDNATYFLHEKTKFTRRFRANSEMNQISYKMIDGVVSVYSLHNFGYSGYTFESE